MTAEVFRVRTAFQGNVSSCTRTTDVPCVAQGVTVLLTSGYDATARPEWFQSGQCDDCGRQLTRRLSETQLPMSQMGTGPWTEGTT